MISGEQELGGRISRIGLIEQRVVIARVFLRSEYLKISSPCYHHGRKQDAQNHLGGVNQVRCTLGVTAVIPVVLPMAAVCTLARCSIVAVVQ